MSRRLRRGRKNQAFPRFLRSGTYAHHSPMEDTRRESVAAALAGPSQRFFMKKDRGIRRRQFIAVGAGLAASTILAVPCIMSAQQAKLRRVAIISLAVPLADMTESGDPAIAAFLRELHRPGFVNGQNIALEVYSAAGRTERGPELGHNVVASKPDVIVVAGSSDISRAIAAVNKH